MGLTQRELRPSDSMCWYALSVRHQHERSAGATLAAQDWETLVPLYRGLRRWSDRVKEIDLPLFAGYVFCRFPYDERVRLLNVPGIRTVVGFGGKPASIPDREIGAIQALMRSKIPLRPWPYLKPGDRVRVERGPLKGLEGTLLREKDSLRLVVGVELLQRSVAAELGPEMVVPV